MRTGRDCYTSSTVITAGPPHTTTLGVTIVRFRDLSTEFPWVRYAGQMDSDVTYAYVYNQPVSRLRGESDILYIGKTEQAIRVRFEQETRTRNSPGNTQQTNIRTTFILEKLGLANVSLHYVRSLSITLDEANGSAFLQALRTWDKRSYMALAEAAARTPEVSLEKYLLVRYASDHLEVPPLNNRM